MKLCRKHPEILWPTGGRGCLRSVRWSFDGTMLVSGHLSGSLCFWDRRTHKSVHEVAGLHTQQIVSVAVGLQTGVCLSQLPSTLGTSLPPCYIDVAFILVLALPCKNACIQASKPWVAFHLSPSKRSTGIACYRYGVAMVARWVHCLCICMCLCCYAKGPLLLTCIWPSNKCDFNSPPPGMRETCRLCCVYEHASCHAFMEGAGWMGGSRSHVAVLCLHLSTWHAQGHASIWEAFCASCACGYCRGYSDMRQGPCSEGGRLTNFPGAERNAGTGLCSRQRLVQRGFVG